MIIGYLEDGHVRIYPDLDAALEEWAPYPTDLLSDVVRLYQDDGVWLKPEAVYVPRRWLPWLTRLSHVNLKPADAASEQEDTLEYLLAHEAVALVPNKHVTSLDQLRQRYPYRINRGA
jgi:hypothetical protein